MSEETKATKAAKNRREWIKNAAIIFLSIMLVLTLFSNTFMNYSLPEVSTQYVMPGTITTKVRGTGSINASDPYSVVLNESRVVASVPVRVGDIVQKGDVILLLEETESDELKEAEKQLESMISAYQSGIISSSIPAEDVYAAQNGTGASFSDNLAKLAQMEKDLEAKQNLLKSYDAQILDAQRQREAAGKEIGVPYSPEYMDQVRENIRASQELIGRYDELVQNWETAKTALENARKELENAQAGGLSEEELKQYQDAVSLAEQNEADTASLVNEAERAPSKIDFWNIALKMDDYTNRITELENAKVNTEAEIATLTEECSKLRASSGNIQALRTQLEEIEEQRALIEELKKKATAAEVTAPVSGTITSLGYRAGEKVEAGMTVATIQISGKECTMSLSVTADQAKALRVGDVADIQNGWYFSGVTATISAIKVDPEKPQTNKLIVFTIEGDVMDGQSLSVSVGQKSAEYSLTVPNSAIREDNNGKFILIVEYKSSPLGTRYVATRVDVEVLASDEKNSAISAALNSYEYVITTASKPVEPGQLIRLAE